LLDDDRGGWQCGEFGQGVVERAVDQRLGEVLRRLALDGGDQSLPVADGVVADGQGGAAAVDRPAGELVRVALPGCRSRS
jgi:hypothetical protein